MNTAEVGEVIGAVLLLAAGGLTAVQRGWIQFSVTASIRATPPWKRQAPAPRKSPAVNDVLAQTERDVVAGLQDASRRSA